MLWVVFLEKSVPAHPLHPGKKSVSAHPMHPGKSPSPHIQCMRGKSPSPHIQCIRGKSPSPHIHCTRGKSPSHPHLLISTLYVSFCHFEFPCFLAIILCARSLNNKNLIIFLFQDVGEMSSNERWILDYSQQEYCISLLVGVSFLCILVLYNFSLFSFFKFILLQASNYLA